MRNAGNTRTGSIARRLNAALVRRKYLKGLLLDILIALLILCVWGVTVEGENGGRITNVSERWVGVSVFEILPDKNWNIPNDDLLRYRIFYALGYPTHTSNGDYIRRGVSYRFTVDGNIHHEDATDIVIAVCLLTAVLLAAQLIGFIAEHFTGRGLIKRYLRPIDEIALSAERISSAQAEKSTDTAQVASLEHAINKIDDSDKRVAVHDSELGGLEAAVNNMLKRLEDAKRKQIRFVDDASHELRTPIAVIQGYVNMLDRWGKDDPKVMEESIAAIKNESEHMKTLIDQLLFLARGDMDRHALHKMPLDACDLMNEVAEESRMIDGTHEYEFEPDPEPRTIHADPAMIKQALRILTDNASKYTPAGGTIKFRVYEKGGKIHLEVTDSGIGIPHDELPRIFDRFYRGQNLRGDSNSGSGLGLSIAKWIVEEHGGTISAMSREGIGTKMTVSLAKVVG